VLSVFSVVKKLFDAIALLPISGALGYPTRIVYNRCCLAVGQAVAILFESRKYGGI